MIMLVRSCLAVIASQVLPATTCPDVRNIATPDFIGLGHIPTCWVLPHAPSLPFCTCDRVAGRSLILSVSSTDQPRND